MPGQPIRCAEQVWDAYICFERTFTFSLLVASFACFLQFCTRLRNMGGLSIEVSSSGLLDPRFKDMLGLTKCRQLQDSSAASSKSGFLVYHKP